MMATLGKIEIRASSVTQRSLWYFFNLISSGLQDLEHHWQTGENAGTTQGEKCASFTWNVVRPNVLIYLHPYQSSNIFPATSLSGTNFCPEVEQDRKFHSERRS